MYSALLHTNMIVYQSKNGGVFMGRERCCHDEKILFQSKISISSDHTMVLILETVPLSL